MIPKKFIKNHSLLLVIYFLITFEISGQSLTNLPTIYINTQSGEDITSTDYYLNAKLNCVSSTASDNLSEEDIKIRGRGNSTWNMPKKSYRIKFSHKLHFLNLPANQDNWVLLANYADKTLLRNALAFELGRKVGFEFTPSTQFVDVVLNGEYIGNYMVTDQVEVKNDRVNVEKLDNTITSLPDITGGYMLEADGYASGNVNFITNQGMTLVVKYPDENDINYNQIQYISSYAQELETALFSSDFTNELSGYRKHIDIPSFVNWYLCSEITGNPDSFWSTYFYKRRNDLHLRFGPLWDFDIAFNNDNRLGDATQNLMIDVAHDYNRQWTKQLLSDPWLHNEVAKRWIALKRQGVTNHLLDYLRNMSITLDASQQLNFDLWDILNRRVYRELNVRGTYSAEVKFMNDYLINRFAFLDTQFQADEVTAVGGNEIDSSIKLFPNPATDNTVLTYETSSPSKIKISIYDMAGRLINTQIKMTVSGINTFSLSPTELKLSPGIYLIELATSDDHIQSMKLVVLN